MGHPNENLMRQGYDAFSRGDMDTLRSCSTPTSNRMARQAVSRA
jgi:ketosteroid isomerase-like protein